MSSNSAGKLRIGSFLNMQNMEVGTTYDMARLPSEVYTVAPVYDFNGFSVNKTWYTDTLEINFEVMRGVSSTAFRQYLSGREQAEFMPIDIDVKGMMLSINKDDDLYRAGWYRSDVKHTGEGFVNDYSVVPFQALSAQQQLALLPSALTLGLTPEQLAAVSASMRGDVINPSYVNNIIVDVMTIGADLYFDNGVHFMGEYARRVVEKMNTGPDSHAFHVNLSRPFGNWVPYVGYAKMWSGKDERDNWKKAKNAEVPNTGGAVPMADAAIAQQYAPMYKDAASGVYVYDQNSIMLGATYRIGATQKIKFEVMRTHIGEKSSMVDSDVSNDDIFVYSLMYTFAF